MSESNFIIAKNLALWASNLDDVKENLPETLKSQASVCVVKMHQMARALAGNQVEIIYADDD